MKDEKVTLDTAKLLKEKNFDILVHGCYVEYNVTRIDPVKGYNKDDIEIETSYFINNDPKTDYSNSSYTMYARPTQSLLARWLREVHNIHIGLDYMFGWTFFITYIPKSSQEIKWSDNNYNTYEEALEAGFKKVFSDYMK